MLTQNHKDVYSYSTMGRDFPTNEAAKEYLLKIFGDKIVWWEMKCYDDCEWHGDSTIGLNLNGNAICEIKCLLNGNFCNPLDGDECGYTEEKEKEKKECSSHASIY